MATKTATVGAWLTNGCANQVASLLDMDAEEIVSVLGFAVQDMSTVDWVRVGTATVAIDLLPTQPLAEAAIAALRRKQGELHAESTAIERQIQSLLAIGYEAGSAA